MNFRTTLILLVVLTGVAAFVIIANRGSETDTGTTPTNPADIAKGKKLFDTKADDVDKLVLRPGEGSPAGSKTIELVKAGAKWNMNQPVSWPADTFDARNLVEGFLDLRTHGAVDLTTENKSATGLDKPRFQVELTDKDGKTIKVAIGNRTALGSDLYVSTDDGKSGELVGVGTLGEKLDKGAEKLVESLRDKQLLKLTSTDVKQIEVTRGQGGPGQTLVLNKVGDDWKLISPKAETADNTEVSDLLSTVTGLRADAFVDPSAPEAAEAQFAKPRATVWLSSAAPTTQPTTGTSSKANRGGVTVTIGEPTDVKMEKAYVQVSDPAVIAKVALTATTFDKLAKASPLSLLDRRALNIDPAKVSELSLDINRPATTQPTTKPAEQRLIQVARRKESFILGPMLPSGPVGPSTAPTTVPTTLPTTVPVGSAGQAAWPSPLLALTGALATTDDATPPSNRPSTIPDTAPSTAPASANAGPTTASAATTLAAATQPIQPEVPATAATTLPGSTTLPTTTAIPTTAAALPPASVVPPPPASKWILASEAGISADDDQVKELLDALHPLKAEKYLEAAPATQPTANYVLTIKTVGAGGADNATYELRITDPGGEAKLIAHCNDLTFELDRAILKKLDGDFKTKKPPETPSTPPPSFNGGGGFPGGFNPGAGG